MLLDLVFGEGNRRANRNHAITIAGLVVKVERQATADRMARAGKSPNIDECRGVCGYALGDGARDTREDVMNKTIFPIAYLI